MHPQLLKVISSWLSERWSVVIVDGVASLTKVLSDSVCQGTVLGPPLWNCYYEGARRAVNTTQCVETVFADDLNCF